MSHRWIVGVGLALSLPCVSLGRPLGGTPTPENLLPVTKGVYRLPFAAGTAVVVSNDHVTHDPHNRLDMSPTDNSQFHDVLAPGDGWIEYIQDGFDLTCPKATSGNPNPCSSYSGPSACCCVRNTSTCTGTCPADTTCRNNYVFLRHPNGEWSKLTHFQAGSVQAEGWAVGDWVQSGEALGVEGDVGLASGVHLHYEVAVPDFVDDSLSPSDPGYDPLGIDPATCNVCGVPDVPDDDPLLDDPNANRQNRIPVFCQLPFPLRDDGTSYIAADCDGQCSTNTSQLFGTITDDNVFYRQVTSSITVSASGFTVESGAGASVRAGTVVTLGPGLHAEEGSFFAASIGPCDSPGN